MYEDDYINYTRRKIVYSDGTEEAIECFNKIQQYEGTTTIFERSGTKVEVACTNNSAIAEINGDIKQIQKNRYEGPKLLWQNTNPSQPFTAQAIVLNDRRDNYDYIEVTWRVFYSVADRDMITKSTAINGLPNYSMEGGKIYRRLYLSGVSNTMQFTDCSYYSTYAGTVTTNNDFLIPVKIIGYKTELYKYLTM